MTLPDVLDQTVLTELLEPMSLTAAGQPTAIGDDYGSASVRAAVAVTAPDGTTSSAVVKVWDAQKIGLDEIDFYEAWAPQLPIRLPRLLGADADDRHGVVVLERIDPARHGDDKGFADPSEGCQLARLLAEVHCATVGAESDLRRAPGAIERPDDWHDTRRVALTASHGLPDHEPARAIVVHSRRASALASEMLAPAHPGLSHTDVHLDNVLFTDEGPVLLDWARAAWGPAAVDLAGLLITSVRVDDYETVIAGYRDEAEVTDEALHGALLGRITLGLLDMAGWGTATARQELLKDGAFAKKMAAIEWLDAVWPEMAFHLLI